MRIGTMFLGRVEVLQHESVQTKFFVFGVPLFPLMSYYVTGARGSGASSRGVPGFEIPVHPTSVLAGYLRTGLFVVAAVAGVIAWIEHDSYEPHTGLWILAGLAMVAWIVSLSLIGHLSPREKLRRTLLREVTGVGAPPSALPWDVRKEVLGRLEKEWEDKGEAGDWEECLVADRAEPEQAFLLLALAEYKGNEELSDRALRMSTRMLTS